MSKVVKEVQDECDGNPLFNPNGRLLLVTPGGTAHATKFTPTSPFAITISGTSTQACVGDKVCVQRSFGHSGRNITTFSRRLLIQ
jgi:hypothetical protein